MDQLSYSVQWGYQPMLAWSIRAVSLQIGLAHTLLPLIECLCLYGLHIFNFLVSNSLPNLPICSVSHSRKLAAPTALFLWLKYLEVCGEKTFRNVKCLPLQPYCFTFDPSFMVAIVYGFWVSTKVWMYQCTL